MRIKSIAGFAGGTFSEAALLRYQIFAQRPLPLQAIIQQGFQNPLVGSVCKACHRLEFATLKQAVDFNVIRINGLSLTPLVPLVGGSFVNQ
jgi:hypothetical protein